VISHTSISWTPAIDNRTNEVIKIKFSGKDCQSCPSRPLCTHSTRYPRRTITVRREQPYQALQRARARATTEEFKTLYAQRAGVEGTISEASAGDGTSALPLHWSRKDASSAPGYRCCHKYRSFDALAGWSTSCSDQAIGFGSTTPPGCLKHGEGFASSISISEVG
jgi:DDE family transposase